MKKILLTLALFGVMSLGHAADPKAAPAPQQKGCGPNAACCNEKACPKDCTCPKCKAAAEKAAAEKPADKK